MKVLLINTSERTGGAAIAARRLCEALRRQNIDVVMMVGDKQGQERWIKQAAPQWRLRFYKAVERARIWMMNGFSKQNLWSVDATTDGADITQTLEFQQADVIHLHWVNQGFLSASCLMKIMHSGKRIVWTMHDMWPFTGICHYSEECKRYRQECGDCKLLRYPGRTDLSRRMVADKREWYRGINITFVACSHWLEEMAKSSSLLRRADVRCISNPLDTSIFYPAQRTEARKRLGLPLRDRLVLFASMKVTDKRKGVDYLLEAARLLQTKFNKTGSDLSFMVMGQHAEQLRQQLQFPVHAMGYVSEPERVADIYRAADVFVIPSLSDNLPNTIVEAMACGTPCVGFRIGGIPEMIDHLANGYVANYKDSEDLARGILHVLSEPFMGSAAEHYACYQYDQDRVARQYAALYREKL